MFDNVLNFELQRSKKEALGFFLAHLLLVGILAGLSAAIDALIAGQGSFEGGGRIGQIISVFYCIVLGIAVCIRKNLLSSFKTILFILLSGSVAVFLGGLGGLIPVAYLSTLPKKYNH